MEQNVIWGLAEALAGFLTGWFAWGWWLNRDARMARVDKRTGVRGPAPAREPATAGIHVRAAADTSDIRPTNPRPLGVVPSPAASTGLLKDAGNPSHTRPPVDIIQWGGDLVATLYENELTHQGLQVKDRCVIDRPGTGWHGRIVTIEERDSSHAIVSGIQPYPPGELIPLDRLRPAGLAAARLGDFLKQVAEAMSSYPLLGPVYQQLFTAAGINVAP